MSRKALRIIVDVEIQAVTCPGVWLYPNGNIQLLFSMLGQEVQTKRLPPVFPLLFHEKLTFQKTFTTAGCLAEIQDALSKEDVYAVLLQETDYIGYRAAIQLARFHSTALQILYPSPCSKGLLAGVDVDLLMEPSAEYPGILSPKIELSTRTIIEEVTNHKPEGFIINPKTLCSQKTNFRGSSSQDKRIVHSNGRYRHRFSPQGQNGKSVEHQTGSVPTGQNTSLKRCPHMKTLQGTNLYGPSRCSLTYGLPDMGEICNCETGHLTSNCPLCNRYKAIFSSMSDFPDEVNEKRNQSFETASSKFNPLGKSHLENTKRLTTALHARVDRVLEPATSSIVDTEQLLIDSGRLFHKRASHPFLSEKPINMKGKDNSRPEGPSFSPKVPHSQPQSGISCGDGADFNSSRQLFYANLEKFYRKLYARAKSRAQAEMDQGFSTK